MGGGACRPCADAQARAQHRHQLARCCWASACSGARRRPRATGLQSISACQYRRPGSQSPQRCREGQGSFDFRPPDECVGGAETGAAQFFLAARTFGVAERIPPWSATAHAWVPGAGAPVLCADARGSNAIRPRSANDTGATGTRCRHCTFAHQQDRKRSGKAVGRSDTGSPASDGDRPREVLRPHPFASCRLNRAAWRLDALKRVMTCDTRSSRAAAGALTRERVRASSFAGEEALERRAACGAAMGAAPGGKLRDPGDAGSPRGRLTGGKPGRWRMTPA